MEILHLKELGVTKSLTNICMYLPILYPLSNFEGITQLVMDILHFKGLGDTENHNEHSLGVYLVIDNFVCI